MTDQTIPLQVVLAVTVLGDPQSADSTNDLQLVSSKMASFVAELRKSHPDLISMAHITDMIMGTEAREI